MLPAGRNGPEEKPEIPVSKQGAGNGKGGRIGLEESDDFRIIEERLRARSDRGWEGRATGGPGQRIRENEEKEMQVSDER